KLPPWTPRKNFLLFTSPVTLYKTGDLARWLADGNIEFLGRLDFQVKIRGIRIETGEIESRLLNHDGVKDVVVEAKEVNTDKYLCAYIVTSSLAIPFSEFVSRLKEYLSGLLPPYMIPSYFVQLDKMPLLFTGKVDRKALPKPGIQFQKEYIYTAPRDELQEKLLKIWMQVLGRDAVHVSPGNGVEHVPIGIDINFFDIGGHSLKATQLAFKLQEEFQVNISLTEIFKRPTIKALAEYIKEGKKETYAAIEAAEEREYYALSSAQRRLYITQPMEKDNISYNMPTALELEGEPENSKLEKTFKQLIERHESLRTCFETINETPVQKILEHVEFEIEYYDLATENTEETRELAPLSKDPATGNWQLVTSTIKNFIRPFDLLRAPLLRVGLIKLKETIHFLMLDMHHIISDGISVNIFVKEFMSLYGGEELEPLLFRYKDYSEWQNKRKHGESTKQQENYWLKQFGNQGDIPVLNLAVDYARPAIKNIEGNRVSFEIGKEDTGALKALALKEDVTLYMLLFSIYNVFLSKLSGQEDIIVGTPTAGRRYTYLHQVIGMFVNTLALRNYPGGEKRFNLFLGEVKEHSLAAFDNQDYQYDDLVEQLSVKGSLTRDVGRNPLFDVMFALQNMERPGLEIPGLKIKHCEYESIMQTAKFDLTLVGYESGQTLFFTFEYRTTLFKKETIERFSRYFKELVSIIPGALERKIADIEIIPGEEKKRILYEFNDTTADYPAGKAIHQLFEEQVERTPDNIALIGEKLQITNYKLQKNYKLQITNYKQNGALRADLNAVGGMHLSYGELNKKAGQLAEVLKEKDVLADTIIGIMVERSIETIISLLGILKVGGVYLPIDPDYPEERKQYMLKDSGAKILLTKQDIAITFSPEAFNNRPKGTSSFGIWNLEFGISPFQGGQLAYIIYTSGTTGKPKGVIVEHGSLVNLCCWHNRYFNVMESDRASQYASIGFDASVWEIFPYLVKGVPLHIISDRVKYDIQAVNAYFERHHITIAFLPTPVCEQFMEIENHSLRILLTGGDKLHTYKQGNYDLYNNYGPTENTVVTTSCPVEPYIDNIPIGKPIHNNQVYILNKASMYLQPIGVPGELCIAGRSLARGYLNDPELTAEKFFSVSYRSYRSYMSYIYRTGDLARWLPDGNIQFLGRIDSQVKIRGTRIELGEIESQLLTHEGVKEAVVITVHHEGTRTITGSRGDLCAYVVPSVPGLSIRELKEYLRGKLPAAMIPLYFVQLEKMPLTPGGKVDRNALPAPTSAAIRDEYEVTKAPGTEIEKRLADAWQEVLGIEEIGIDEDFFEAGGDSIKAIQVSARLLQYGLKMEISDLLANPTIKQLGQYIKRTDNCRVPDQGTVEGKVPLTPIQKWFFRNNFTHSHHFNQSVMIYRKVGFDESFLRQLFAKIVAHHDALRMVYQEEENGIVQWNRGLEGPLFDLKIMDLKDSIDIAAEIENAANKIQRTIDLETGPLVQLGLFKTNAGDHLLIVIHHLVADGVSWRILLEDIAAGYSQLEKGEKIVLQEKTDSFRYWSQKLLEYSESKTLLRELEYWRTVEETGICNLPQDFEKTDEKEKTNASTGEIVTMNLDEKDTETLLKEVNQAYNTEINDILLTGLGIAVKEWSGIEKPVINLEGHGRENIIAGVDISRTIGWFTCQFPVVLDMSRWEDLSYGIKFVKETLRKIPNKGIGYGILRYLTPSGKREGLTFEIEPEISFNYLGQFDRGNRNGIFKISQMKMGDTVSPQSERTHALNISGIITEGKLRLIFNYNKYEYRRFNIEKLVDGFQSHLLKIIHHCAKKEDRELTPVDMKYSKLTMEKLEELEDRVSGIDFD
ncbi:MAG: amino acid adenylation domain-containing protein, partial [Candidatus Aminicenantes bacterium]